MFHLDNNSGVSAMPTPAATQNKTVRWFTEGSGNQSPSWPGQDWFNIIQAELLSILTAANITPDKSKINQLALAIKAIANKDAFLKSNLLSEIKTAGATSQATARNNIGLGSSATKDVGTASGNVMEVGAFGLGGNGVTVSDADTIDKNGIYRLTVDGIHGPAVKVAAEIIHIQYDGASANQIGWIAGVGNGKMYHRARAGSVFGGWLPLVDQNGGTLKGDNALLVLQNTAAAADKKALYIRGLNSDGSMRWYVGNGGAGNDFVQLSDYVTGAQLQLAETCTINKPLKVTGNFDATGSGNFPGGVAAAGGITLNSGSPVGMYFGADAASFDNCNMLLKSWCGIGFYNTCTSTGIQGITGYINVRTGNMSMKSTITPGDYANFDARFYTKTLSDAKYSLKTATVTATRQGTLVNHGQMGDSFTAPAGCSLVGLAHNGSSDTKNLGISYCPDQHCINGVWTTKGRQA